MQTIEIHSVKRLIMLLIKHVILLIILFIISTIAFSNSSHSEDIVPLEKGEKAPFAGALVSADKFDLLRQIDEKNRLLEKKILTLQDLNVIMADRVDLNKKLAEEYKIDYTKSEAKRSITNIGHFLLGVAITALSFKLAQEIREN